MQTVAQAVLRSWSIPPVTTLALALTAITYLRGAWLLRRAGYRYLSVWRVGSFALGLFSLWAALASPLDTFSGFVLTAHMLQHMVLMMLAPPLILLGEPLIPVLRGMPRFAAREFAGPFLNWRIARRVGRLLTNPIIALLVMGVAMFSWHIPGPYEFALRSSAWHQVEHACFFLASIIFWWPVIQPWPRRALWPRWAMVPYLLVADLQNTVLSAALVFSDKILYPTYASAPGLFGLTPRNDQAAAGAVMWVIGSLAFVVPAALIAIRCLANRQKQRASMVLEPPKSKFGAGTIPASTGLWTVGASKKPLNPRWMDAASFAMLIIVVAGMCATLSNLSADGDDQTLRFSQTSGRFDIRVYGPAGDPSVGPANFAVMVQDAASHDVLLDSNVELSLREASNDRPTLQRVHALPGSENKLLFDAEVNLESEGAWILTATVRCASESATVSMPIDVAKEASQPRIHWTYIWIMAFVGVFCGTYAWRHRTHRMISVAARTT